VDSSARPVVFIHGLWLHASSSQPWVDRFAKQYRGSPAATELVEFPDRGHSLTIDHGWPELADTALRWFADKGLAPR
jgi:hypothetical protein